MKKTNRILVLSTLITITQLLPVNQTTQNIPTNSISALEYRAQNSHHTNIPELLPMQRSATRNGYGCIFYNISPVGYEFINQAKPGKKMLEIGSGFSNITEQCLRRGVTEYTANDLSLEHLDILLSRLQESFGQDTEKQLQPLRLLVGKAPDVLPDIDNYYDAILIDKVLHFFSPEEADIFFKWAHKALTPGGMLAIFTVSTYCDAFKVDALTAAYQHNQNNNQIYPGFIPNVQTYIEKQLDYTLPTSMLFFKSHDLATILQAKNFDIVTIFNTYRPQPGSTQWLPISEEKAAMVGIIAKKQQVHPHVELKATAE